MRSIVYFLGVAFWLTISVAGSGEARSDDLSTLRQTRTTLRQSLGDQQREIAQITQQLDELSTKISRLKSKEEKKRALLRGYRLQSMLTQAQEISDQLQEMTAGRDQTLSALKVNRQALIETLDRAIERQADIASHRGRSKQARKAAALKLAKLSQDRVTLSMEQSEATFPATAAGLIGNGVHPEEVQVRLAAIQDFERRLHRERKFVRKELADARRQTFLRSEVSHLLEEEAFFSERGFISGGAARTKDTEASALGKITQSAPGENGSKETPDGDSETTAGEDASMEDSVSEEAATEEAATEDSGLTDDTELAGKDDLPAGEDLGGMPQDEMTATGEIEGLDAEALTSLSRLEMGELEGGLDTAETTGRDPLTQLASELGLITKDLRDVASPALTDSLQQRIRWLERRLTITENLLQKLKQAAHKLERSLPK